MKVYTIQEVAEILQSSEKTVRQLIADGRLDAFNIAPLNHKRGAWRISEDALKRLMRED